LYVFSIRTTGWQVNRIIIKEEGYKSSNFETKFHSQRKIRRVLRKAKV
jgi:hypothetical protein